MTPALLGVVLALSAAPWHPNSQSSSRVVVRGHDLQLEIVCQSRSLAESVPIDLDGDARFDAEELEQGRAAAFEYLREHYTIAPRDRAPLELVGVALEIVDDGPFDEQRLHARLRGQSERDFDAMTLCVRLFYEQNPFHRDAASVVWNDDAPASWLFAEGVDTWHFESAELRRPGVFASFVGLGVEHIAIGYDHIAFLLALIVAAGRVRSLVGVVSAFTLAHSITLAAAALGLVSVPGRLVEIAIALSIAYVAAENLLFPRPAARWMEAFGFGLVHGLGFASVLGATLLEEPLRITALVGFNLGVELGQLVIVLVAALALRWLPGDRAFADRPRAWFAPRWVRRGVSSAVVVLGLYWFALRAGWLA